jgi:molybdenum storage protein
VAERPFDATSLTELGERLLTESLSDPSLLRATDATPDHPILPWVNVVKIGGQSIMDRGRAAVYPLVDEIVANLGAHKMILGTGAGTRARHIYSMAIDLGLPTGVLTVLGTAVAWQNAQMLHYLLARHGIPFIIPESFDVLPHYLMERHAVVCQGMPPYKLWESNPVTGRIPPQRTDTGCFLIAEVFGARKMIYVKDEDGLYTADPKKDRSAKHIPRIELGELLARDLDDLVVERAVLEMMTNARHVKEIQFVNGLKPGQLTAALNGQPVGSVVYRAAQSGETTRG